MDVDVERRKEMLWGTLLVWGAATFVLHEVSLRVEVDLTGIR